MKAMYVYILKCSDNTYYTGVTNNLERRVEEHHQGVNTTCYTYLRIPLELISYQLFNDPIRAIAFEKKLKGWRREKKEALINGKYQLLPELSKNKINRMKESSTSSD